MYREVHRQKVDQGWDVAAKWCKVSLWGDKNILASECWQLHTINLKTTELCILKG